MPSLARTSVSVSQVTVPNLHPSVQERSPLGYAPSAIGCCEARREPLSICRSHTVHLENTKRKAVVPFQTLCPAVSSTQSTGGLGQAIDGGRSGAVLLGTVVHLLAVRCYGSHTQDPSINLSTPRSAHQRATTRYTPRTPTTSRKGGASARTRTRVYAPRRRRCRHCCRTLAFLCSADVVSQGYLPSYHHHFSVQPPLAH
ncbi:hypothetical protein BDW22DRAFT_853572 [Trametopsis cervina]|nr:hypothetical protein BDW22DRAFT_853572 [Trametopsis cervina]